MHTIEPGRKIYVGNVNTSETEIRDLLKAWAAISIAFALVLRHDIGLDLYKVFIISSVTVGMGFLLHELGHKFVAQRYGCFAEFRSFDRMLILAIIMSFFGFVFAAPGAVMIAGKVDARKNGIISVAGPLVNLALALTFLSVLFLFPSGMLKVLAFYGFFINSWLALFNMIPILNLDGAKVIRWDKKVYAAVVVFALALLFLQNFISIA